MRYPWSIMSGRRRGITENDEIELIEEYYHIVVQPTSRLRWGAFLTSVHTIFGPTLILRDVGAYLGRLTKGCQFHVGSLYRANKTKWFSHR